MYLLVLGLNIKIYQTDHLSCHMGCAVGGGMHLQVSLQTAFKNVKVRASIQISLLL